MPIYKSTDGITKINTTPTIFRGAEIVFGSGLFVSASGGNITTDGDYKIHTFSTPGTSSFTIESIASPNNLNSVEYLIQGGGGSGAKQPGAFAGGGAGGGIQTGSFTISPTTYEVIVGAGGIFPGGSPLNGIPGNDSSLGAIVGCGGGGGETSGTDEGGGDNCDFTASGNAGASNNSDAIENILAPDGLFSSISGTSTQYGRGGDSDTGSPRTGVIGQGGNAGSGLSITAGNGEDGIVIVRYKYK